MIQEAIRHYEYGISHDIFKEPVTTYAELSIDALEKLAVYEQIKWERDVAISQLEDIGCGLGRKMDDIKEAIEKQKAKKVIRQKGKCYSITKDGKQYHEILLLCPNCHRAIKRTEALDVHCKYCGQHISWIEEGDS